MKSVACHHRGGDIALRVSGEPMRCVGNGEGSNITFLIFLGRGRPSVLSIRNFTAWKMLGALGGK